MSDKMVTRCPQCGTSFRVTPAQLHSARGAVRCGSCLHIFRAQEHLIGDDKDKTAIRSNPKTAATRTGSARATATTRTGASKPATPAPQTRKPATAKPAAPAPTKPVPAAGKNNTRTLPPAPSASSDDDEDFLISDDMDQPKSEKGSYGDGLSDEFLSLEQSQAGRVSLFDREIRQTQQEMKDGADESWAMNLLSDEEEEQVRLHPKPSSSPADDNLFVQVEETSVEQVTETLADTTQADERILIDELPDSETLNASYAASGNERSALLLSIEADPLELQAPPNQEKRQWLWLSLSALAAILLIVQVAWLQFDRLSYLQPYRSAYEVICPIVGCKVPELLDRRQISAYNLVVRNHPRVENALVVDAILLNAASFEQRFPDLVLDFSNLDGQLLASRRFVPREYLGGELAGRTIMPRNQPVHITLELVDPGPDAVNYRAYIPE